MLARNGESPGKNGEVEPLPKIGILIVGCVGENSKPQPSSQSLGQQVNSAILFARDCHSVAKGSASRVSPGFPKRGIEPICR